MQTLKNLATDGDNLIDSGDIQFAACVYVDLDGTFVSVDTFHESLINTAHRRPELLFAIPFWLLRGPAHAKRCAAIHGGVDVASLPYRPAVMELIRNARENGKRVVLATGADREIADQVGRHIGMFDAVLASDGKDNLVGARKLAAIRGDCAGRTFCYVGNSNRDKEIWRNADAALVVSSDTSLAAWVRSLPIPAAEVKIERAGFATWFSALRCGQWMKNLLVFLPLLPVAKFASEAMFFNALSTFVVFCLVASATYLFNDLLDLRTDRMHPLKRQRALASGSISALAGTTVAALLGSMACLLAAFLVPLLAGICIAAYVMATIAYSLWLKEQPLVDVWMLTGLYSLRILAGGAAIGLMPSPWMLAFSMFLFFSLALGKRYTELVMTKNATDSSHSRRGYVFDDAPLMLITGICAGQLSVMTLALYWSDPATHLRFAHPTSGWLLCPLLLFWLCRFWFKAHRGELDDDPVAFVLRDRATPVMAIISAALVFLAL